MTIESEQSRPTFSEVQLSFPSVGSGEFPDRYNQEPEYVDAEDTLSPVLIAALVDIHSGPSRSDKERDALAEGLGSLRQLVVKPAVATMFDRIIIIYAGDPVYPNEQRDMERGVVSQVDISGENGEMIDSVVATRERISLSFDTHTNHHITGEVKKESGIARSDKNEPRRNALICAAPHDPTDQLPEILHASDHDITLILTTTHAERQLMRSTQTAERVGIGVHPTVYVQPKDTAADLT